MIDYTDVEKTVIKMESERDTSFAALETLAPLYTALIYRRLTANSEVYEAQPLAELGDSDFLLAVSGKDSVKAWAVMDELMDMMMLANRKVYDATLEKIRKI